MTNNPAAPARDGNPIAQYGKRDRPPMGRAVVDDPEKELRIFYNLEMRQFEDDPGLWLDKARSMADPWLTKQSVLHPPDRGKLIMAVQGLKHDHTQDGFLEFMRDIKREYEATKELAAKVNGKPKLDPFGKPVDPVKVAMRQLVFQASGNENDYDYRFDTNVYVHDTEVQMAEIDTTPLVTAAITQGKDDPTPTPSPDEEISEKELDKFFGKKPAKHFSEDAEWWKKADKLFRKYREAAIIEHRRTAICEWLEIPDMKQWDVMPEAALGLITAELDARFGAKAKVATPEPVKSVVPGYDPNKANENKPNKAAVDNVGAVDPGIKNSAPVAPKKADSDGVIESDDKLIDKAQFRKQRTIKIQGQNYLKAGDRVVMFRADHPGWAVETEAVQLSPDFAVFKATVKDDTGKLLATAHGYCTPSRAQKVSGRFVEKAETAAVARVLAFVGYGTDDSLDDSDYLSDSPVKAIA